MAAADDETRITFGYSMCPKLPMRSICRDRGFKYDHVSYVRLRKIVHLYLFMMYQGITVQ